MVNDGLMVFVGAVGEVHADDVEASLAEPVDCLDRVCLGTNCADDGCTAIVLCRLVVGVQLGEPRDLGRARCEVIHSCCGRHVEGRLSKGTRYSLNRMIKRAFSKYPRNENVSAEEKKNCQSGSYKSLSWWGFGSFGPRTKFVWQLLELKQHLQTKVLDEAGQN